MFIHTEELSTFEELKSAGFVPLKESYPFVLLFDNTIKFNFSNKNIEIKDVMYFQ